MRSALLTTALFFASASFLSAQQANCEKPLSTADMSFCATEQLKVAEQEMQATYNRALGAFTPTAKERQEASKGSSREHHFYQNVTLRLKKSQEAWAQYRGSFCATVVETFEGGTGASVSGPECKRELTV